MFFENFSFSSSQLFVVKAAIETGIFDVLLEAPHSAYDVAHKTGLNAKGVLKVLDFLCSMGILDRQNAFYSIKKGYERYFDKSSVFFIGYYVDHAFGLINRWSRLADILKDRREAVKKDPAFFVTMARGLFVVNYNNALLLKGELGVKSRVLDVGCGSCVWSIPFAKEGSHVCGIDFKDVIDNAASFFVDKLGVASMYSFIAGNMFEVDWDYGFDLVIFANIIHSYSDADVRSLFEKAYKSLAPEGELVVIDFIYDYGDFPKIFDINMFIASGDGGVYDLKRLEEIANLSGFKMVRNYILDQLKATCALLFRKG